MGRYIKDSVKGSERLFLQVHIDTKGSSLCFREEVCIKGATLCSQACVYTLVLTWACIIVTRGSSIDVGLYYST